jgi:hypothetical protein
MTPFIVRSSSSSSSSAAAAGYCHRHPHHYRHQVIIIIITIIIIIIMIHTLSLTYNPCTHIQSVHSSRCRVFALSAVVDWAKLFFHGDAQPSTFAGSEGGVSWVTALQVASVLKAAEETPRDPTEVPMPAHLFLRSPKPHTPSFASLQIRVLASPSTATLDALTLALAAQLQCEYCIGPATAPATVVMSADSLQPHLEVLRHDLPELYNAVRPQILPAAEPDELEMLDYVVTALASKTGTPRETCFINAPTVGEGFVSLDDSRGCINVNSHWIGRPFKFGYSRQNRAAHHPPSAAPAAPAVTPAPPAAVTSSQAHSAPASNAHAHSSAHPPAVAPPVATVANAAAATAVAVAAAAAAAASASAPSNPASGLSVPRSSPTAKPAHHANPNASAQPRQRQPRAAQTPAQPQHPGQALPTAPQSTQPAPTQSATAQPQPQLQLQQQQQQQQGRRKPRTGDDEAAPRPSAASGSDSSLVVQLGNLPYSADADAVTRELLTHSISVVSVVIKNQGFADVTVSDEATRDALYNLNAKVCA